ncbi:hypothetical protein [Pelagibacterium sp. H642]|uniref:DUF7133 domain-containing protein n=1 Tax=Pelagibacterium sp. H642 TaxID=1881069 RepID=UPI002815C1BC|nr:hypothetical protein [Pelagibacterium sp. H642]WMT90203.1 hypothetical protein NO934_15615 [Pelagibacterium sp. H642]
MTNRKRNHRAVLALSALTCALMTGTALAQSEQVWPPEFQPMPENFGYMEPEESLETFTLPPGYSIDLVASEPLLGDGIVMQWDYQGRLWVVETTFMLNLEDLTAATPSSSVVILEDTDGDGVMDERKVFADELVLPRSLLILEPGKVILGESPNIWLLEDTDGDDVADSKTPITEGNYGALGGSIEHNPNGMFWNIDNRIYNAYLDEVYQWNGEGFEVDRGISISQWGVTADDQGRILRQGNSAAPSMSYVPDYYYGRSSVFTRNRGNHEWIGGPTRAANRVWPIRPTPGINRGYVEGTLDENGAMIELTSAGGAAVYRGTALNGSDYGNIFVPEPAAQLVTMSTLQDSGSGIYLQKAYEQGDFLSSTEERFRPVFTQVGPDGALYVLDLYHGIIQDAVFMSNYLKDWVDEHNLGDTHGVNGRIYRVSHENGTPSEPIDLTQSTPEELVALLEHENGWYRDHAQRLMVVQQQTDAVPALLELFNSDAEPVARLHAFWTLDGLDAVEPDLVISALDDEDRDIKTAALRIAEPFLSEGNQDVIDAFLGLIGNTNNDWQVKYQLAASAGELDDANRLDAIMRIIDMYGEDYIALDAALSGVPDAQVTELLNALFEAEQGSEGIRNAITTVVSGLTRIGSAQDVSDMLATIAAPDRPAWQREAALLGLEVVLAGVADPGLAPALPRSQAGSWTVGDLGERAFPDFNAEVNEADAEQAELLSQQRAANAPQREESAMTEVDGVPTLTLEEAPEEFLALSEDETLAGRIEGVTILMSWPGKDQ